MKKAVLRLFCLASISLAVCTGSVRAQSTTPPGIPYQAIARNTNGTPYVNAALTVRFSLHEQTATGTVSYSESHSLQTNDLGLFSTTFGSGSAITGTFTAINWAQTTKFLQVEINLGSTWVDMGTQQLMSVPYAMYALNGPVQGCSGVQTFEFTGQTQIFNIPQCANELIIECWGAEGQFGGGRGGYCTGRYYPNNETILHVNVGGKNGFNGGGIGVNPITFNNQNGGGASDVRINNDLTSRLIVAGGGGSGYQIVFYNNNSVIPMFGGDGGGCSTNSLVIYEGEAGTSAANTLQQNNCGASWSTGNFGNLQNNWARASGGGYSGGIAACNGSPCSTTDGVLGIGGNGQVGGGGGYYGGGGASSSGTNATIAASAGGESSWVGGCEPPYYFMGGVKEGNGKVRITWH